MKSQEFIDGGIARKSGLRLVDNPYGAGITDEGVEAYKDWMDGYLEAAVPGILERIAKDDAI